jgi:hypothetical protein
MSAAGAGAQDDDQHDAQHRDHRRCQRAGPAGAGLEGAGHRDGTEADGGKGRADGEPGSEVAIASARGGGMSMGSVYGVTVEGQVCERDGQFFPGAGAQRQRGSPIELVGRDPAGLVGLAQFGQRLVTLSVRYPQVSRRKTSGVAVHDRCSLDAKALETV